MLCDSKKKSRGSKNFIYNSMNSDPQTILKTKQNNKTEGIVGISIN